MRTEFDDERESDSEESSRHLVSHHTQVGDPTTLTPEHEPAPNAASRIARGSATEMPVALTRADLPAPDPEAEAHVSEAHHSELAAALESQDDRRVMEILADTYGEHVYRYCRHLLRNDADSDDISQMVFVQAFQCLKSLPHVRSIRGWLLGIAHNRCIDQLRKIQRDPRAVEPPALSAIIDSHDSDGPDDDDPRIAKALDECLDGLHEKSRAVLMLRFRDGLSYNEIEALMSDTAGALRIRLVRALKALRRCLERKGIRP